MRRKYMFTNRTHSDYGKCSAALGVISVAAIVFVLYTSFLARGNVDGRVGMVAVLSLLFSLIGEGIGIKARLEKERFYFFPNLGLFLNTLAILLVGGLLYVGVYGI